MPWRPPRQLPGNSDQLPDKAAIGYQPETRTDPSARTWPRDDKSGEANRRYPKASPPASGEWRKAKSEKRKAPRNCFLSKILPATPTGSRFCRAFPKGNDCFQEFTSTPGEGEARPRPAQLPVVSGQLPEGQELAAGSFLLMPDTRYLTSE